MGKIFLRRTNTEIPIRPYILSSDDERDFMKVRLGEVRVLPMSVDDGFAIGLSGGLHIGIRMPLGTVQHGKDLSQKVYDCVVEYGKTLANSMPERYEFVDETNGPREIKFHTLGSKS